MATTTRIVMVFVVRLGCGVTKAEPISPRIGLPTDPDAVLLNYDPAVGDLWITLNEGSAASFTTLEITSASNAFRVSSCPAGVFCGLFDIWGGPDGSKIFRLDPAGLSELHIDNALDPGLTADFLVDDLRFDGSYVGGGGLTEVVIPIPEPTALMLCGIGCISIHLVRRRDR